MTGQMLFFHLNTKVLLKLFLFAPPLLSLSLSLSFILIFMRRVSCLFLDCNTCVFVLGNGKTIEIYDGRKSLSEIKTEASEEKSHKGEDSGKGEIIYYRDSDDEMPDSDEDPDDDLDI